MAYVSTRVRYGYKNDPINLDDVVLEVLKNHEPISIPQLKQAIKKHYARFGQLLRYTNRELETTLNHLAQEWVTYYGLQYNLIIRIWQRTYFCKPHILFSVRVRNIPSEG